MDKDIDSMCAIEYLHATLPNKLKSVVLSPYPETVEGKQKVKKLETLFNKARAFGISDVKICEEIPLSTEAIIVSGPLTKIEEYIGKRFETLDLLVVHAGFVGYNVVQYNDKLSIYKNTKHLKSENLDDDYYATQAVLKTSKIVIDKIVFIGDNVCHSPKNTSQGSIWRNDERAQNIFKRYNIEKDKKLCNMLTCREALALIQNTGDYICEYRTVHPFRDKDTKQWGSEQRTYIDTYETYSSQLQLQNFRSVRAAAYILED